MPHMFTELLLHAPSCLTFLGVLLYADTHYQVPRHSVPLWGQVGTCIAALPPSLSGI